jgi:hypothetical protein
MRRYYRDTVRLRLPAAILSAFLLMNAASAPLGASGESEDSTELVTRYLDASRTQQ